MLLSPAVVAVMLFTALLHAGWNVVVRDGTDRRRETALLVCGATVLAVLILRFLPLPPIAVGRYLLTSARLQTVYFILIAEAYAHGGMALAHPLIAALPRC
jgi:hypothetical protein